MLDQQNIALPTEAAPFADQTETAFEGISRRQHVRHAANWAVRCTDEQGSAWDAVVVDCSVGGLGLDRCPPLEIDQIVQITLKDIGTFLARVAWSSGARAGLELQRNANHLDDTEIDTLSAGLSRAPMVTHSML